MRNLIPYIDHSSDEPVERYYADIEDEEEDDEVEKEIRGKFIDMRQFERGTDQLTNSKKDRRRGVSESRIVGQV
jgi:hypothetical protein